MDIKATLFKVQNNGDLKVSDFTGPDKQTPGNVGVCLSGGGSRSMVACMGQLRALEYIKNEKGKSLLSRVKALSTVSGGSWLGGTFEYIPESVSDDDFLNKYVPDQQKLVPENKKGALPEEVLNILPVNNMGTCINKDFCAFSIAYEAITLYIEKEIDPSMIWQTIVGEHLLQPYGLYTPSAEENPTSTFSFDTKTADSIIKDNPSMAREKIHLFASCLDSTKTERPYHICNSSMFVDRLQDNTKYQYLVPVQFTPFFAGVAGKPEGLDANGKTPGGGGVETFAFNSALKSVDADGVAVSQNRQFSLADSIGTSSAFFAEVITNIINKWLKDDGRLVADLIEMEHDNLDRILKRYEVDEKKFWGSIFRKKRLRNKAKRKKYISSKRHRRLRKVLKELLTLVPRYEYWPVRETKPDPDIKSTQFADGGNLENTGIAGLLSYSDIDRVISFVNPATPLSAAQKGVYDEQGNEIANTRIIVDLQLPPLFGYQPYHKKEGYRLYKGADDCSHPVLKYNQIFESSQFPLFLQQLAASAGEKCSAKPALVKMELKVLKNDWFGIKAKENITLLLVYTTRNKEWYQLLSPEVQKLLGDFDDPDSYSGFPYFSTAKTEYSCREINLLANLTAWTVANEKNRPLFEDLFK